MATLNINLFSSILARYTAFTWLFVDKRMSIGDADKEFFFIIQTVRLPVLVSVY